MIVQAILLGLITSFAYGDYALGTCNLSRPIITGPLVGLVLGDLQTGIIIGATLELAFLGSFSVGASIPPEMISGGVLGTAFAITTGKGAEVALALGLPIASLVLVFYNFFLIVVLPLFAHRADKYADEGDCGGVDRMHLLGGLTAPCIPLGILVAISFYLGSPFMEGILNSVPTFIIDGLTIATGLLPALGFALLAKMIINKKVAVFFFFGFVLTAYLEIPVTGIALIGVMLAVILLMNKQNNPNIVADQGGDLDDDF